MSRPHWRLGNLCPSVPISVVNISLAIWHPDCSEQAGSLPLFLSVLWHWQCFQEDCEDFLFLTATISEKNLEFLKIVAEGLSLALWLGEFYS